MKVFLINLDKNPDRLAAADAQLKRLGVEYERFPAVYGKALPEEEKRRAVNRFRWWCAVGRTIRDGEIGCALSHYAIYRRMVEERIPMACVLEDDVLLEDAFPDQLRRVEAWVRPGEPQVVLLSNHTGKNVERAQGIYPTQSDIRTEGYVLTRTAAIALLKANLPLKVPCDFWGRWVSMHILALYHAHPRCCTQNCTQFLSDIGTTGIEVPQEHRTFLKRIIYVVCRGTGKALDSLFVVAACFVRHFRTSKRRG